jgi:hypothetical protein
MLFEQDAPIRSSLLVSVRIRSSWDRWFPFLSVDPAPVRRTGRRIRTETGDSGLNGYERIRTERNGSVLRARRTSALRSRIRIGFSCVHSEIIGDTRMLFEQDALIRSSLLVSVRIRSGWDRWFPFLSVDPAPVRRTGRRIRTETGDSGLNG